MKKSEVVTQVQSATSTFTWALPKFHPPLLSVKFSLSIKALVNFSKIANCLAPWICAILLSLND